MTRIDVPLYVRSSDITGLKECELKWLLSHLYADEKPDAIWFQLGTSLHSGFEAACQDDTLDADQIKQVALSSRLDMELERRVDSKSLIHQKTWNKKSKPKRGIETIEADIDRMVDKWFKHVHPDGSERIKYLEDLAWPPIKLEHMIEVVDPATGVWLKTQVDSVWQHLKFEYVTPIIDWKTGGKAGSGNPIQLWTYQYGGRLEGWIHEDQKFPGGFVHVDFLEKPGGWQHVDEYPGDEIMANWVKTTRMRKAAYTSGSLALPVADWWCNYCPVREFCPQEGDGDWTEVSKLTNAINWVDDPRDWED